MSCSTMGSSEKKDKMCKEEEGLLRVSQINRGILVPMVIKTAVELNLFEIMAEKPGGQFSCYHLASSLPKQSPETPVLIERILRFLASQSILTSTVVTDEDGTCIKLYGMNEVSNYFVRNEDGTSLASSLIVCYDKVVVDCWYHMKDAIVEGGIPFERAHGMSLFEYCAKDKSFSEKFNASMYNHTMIVMKIIHDKYTGFEGAKQLVDVGGGLGANLQLIVSKYPNIKGINFDLPHVIKDAPPFLGVKHVGGDMFKSVPIGDVIFMKWILHDWDDIHCIKLLKNCWASLQDGGKVVVVEAILPDHENDYSNSIDDQVYKNTIALDMFMMMTTPGGIERSINEYNTLAKQAGFISMKIICTISNFCIMEFYKNA